MRQPTPAAQAFMLDTAGLKPRQCVLQNAAAAAECTSSETAATATAAACLALSSALLDISVAT